MDILKLLEELEAELMDKRGVFVKKVNIDRCIDILEDMKASIPDAVREAEYVELNREKILQNADIVAKNTIREAEERAEHIIDNSVLIKRAEIEAKNIIDAAYVQCDMLVDRTKAHLDTMFKEIEQFLLSNLNMIRNNREELRGAMLPRESVKLVE